MVSVDGCRHWGSKTEDASDEMNDILAQAPPPSLPSIKHIVLFTSAQFLVADDIDPASGTHVTPHMYILYVYIYICFDSLLGGDGNRRCCRHWKSRNIVIQK